MANILNYDHWDWVHPETNKVLRLRKGDVVPDEVLSFSEDKEAFFVGPRPVLLKGEDAKEARAESASAPKQQAQPRVENK